MASGDFRDLSETQRETARALQTLVSEIRRSRPGDLGRLTGSLNPAEDRDRLQARVVREIAPSLAAERRGEVAGGAGSAGQVSDVERTLQSAQSAIRALGSGLTASTKDLERTLAAFSGGLQSVFSGLGGGGGFAGLLKGGFGLAGLGLKIAGLFGKDKPAPVSFSAFELPPSLALEAANTDSVLGGFPRFDRGQGGELRSFRGEGSVAPTQVVVNVNALDTQSFLDRSSDVARAVRDAMLHMHPINDLIGEL
jgi:hypothetical protein